jgi:hypothetical protein
MGAVERSGYIFEPEYSVINQKGAIHVYHHGDFIEEIQFNFSGEFPDPGFLEEIINGYCEKHEI